MKILIEQDLYTADVRGPVGKKKSIKNVMVALIGRKETFL